MSRILPKKGRRARAPSCEDGRDAAQVKYEKLLECPFWNPLCNEELRQAFIASAAYRELYLRDLIN